MTTSPISNGDSRHLLEIVLFYWSLSPLERLVPKVVNIIGWQDTHKMGAGPINGFYNIIGSMANKQLLEICPNDVRPELGRFINRVQALGPCTSFIFWIPKRYAPAITQDEMNSHLEKVLTTPRSEYVKNELDEKLDKIDAHNNKAEYNDVVEFFARLGFDLTEGPEFRNDFSYFMKQGIKSFECAIKGRIDLSPLHIADCVEKMLDKVGAK